MSFIYFIAVSVDFGGVSINKVPNVKNKILIILEGKHRKLSFTQG